jgi:putative transposase
MPQLMGSRPNRRRGGRSVQTAFAFRTHGGARRGAGRKKTVASRVPHRARPRVSKNTPVHITLRVVEGVENLRTSRFFRLIHGILVKATSDLPARIVHYSVMRNHLHLIIEAADNRHCSRAMRTLGIRLAKAINTLRRVKGRLIRDRNHVHVLKTPLETKRAIAYVLCNARKHARERGSILPRRWLDPCSSARAFEDWRDESGRALRQAARGDPAVKPPRSWLLRFGWRRHGGIAVDFVPGC